MNDKPLRTSVTISLIAYFRLSLEAERQQKERGAYVSIGSVISDLVIRHLRAHPAEKRGNFPPVESRYKKVVPPHQLAKQRDAGEA